MPTYEKHATDGTLLERTVTLPAERDGSGYDEQMAALAADESIPWHLAPDFPAEAHSDPNPTLAAAVPNQAATDLATGGPITADAPQQPFVHDDLKTEEV